MHASHYCESLHVHSLLLGLRDSQREELGLPPALSFWLLWAHSATILVFFLLLEHTKLLLTSGPLHFLFLLPREFFLYIFMWQIPSHQQVSVRCHVSETVSLKNIKIKNTTYSWWEERFYLFSFDCAGSSCLCVGVLCFQWGGGYSSLWCVGFSWWLLLFRSTGS